MRSCGWKNLNQALGTEDLVPLQSMWFKYIPENCYKMSQPTDINFHQDYRKDEHLCGSSKLRSIKVE
ncbi:hypothetical protein NSTC731_01400 [Nostoc sp. DSM 114167]|jgi:hypothetical protein